MGRKSKYDPYKDWIAEHYLEYRNCPELAKALKDNFGVDAKPRAIKAWFTQRFGMTTMYGRHEFSEDEIEFIKRYYPDHGADDTVEMLKEVFGTDRTSNSVKTLANSKLGLKVRGEFKQRLDQSKIEMMREARTRDIGSNRACVNKNTGNVDHKIKVGENQWKAAGVAIWEQAYGPAPKGYRIIYLDGDNTNLDIDNLYMANNKLVYQVTTNKCYKSGNPEITKSLIKFYELRNALGVDRFQWSNIQRKFERKYGKEFTDATL